MVPREANLKVLFHDQKSDLRDLAHFLSWLNKNAYPPHKLSSVRHHFFWEFNMTPHILHV